MAVGIKLKKSSVAARVPTIGDLDYGELAINYADGILYYKDNSNNIKKFLDSDNLLTSVGALFPNAIRAGGRDYLDIDSATQAITLNAIDLATDITGNLPVSHLNGGSGASDKSVWRGDATWLAIDSDLSVDGSTASTIVVRDGSGDIGARYVFSDRVSMSQAASERASDTVFYSSTDNYVRKNTADGFLTSLNIDSAISNNTSVLNASEDWSTITSNTTASANAGYLVDCTDSSLEVLLPSGPSDGDRIEFEDAGATWNTHNLFTLRRNGMLIDSADSDMTASTDGAAFAATYDGKKYTWRITPYVPSVAPSPLSTIYGPLASANTWTGVQTFDEDIDVDGVNIGLGGGDVATNIRVGQGALASNTTGTQNIAMGSGALNVNTTASNNVAVGYLALSSNTTADNNSAFGRQALFSNTTGTKNNAIGVNTLFSNTTGSSNNALGFQALFANTTGASNIAVGDTSLAANTTGTSNIAVGNSALAANTTASNNVAVGVSALASNTTGTQNVAVGLSSLQLNVAASNNTAVGYGTMTAAGDGASNTAVGTSALAANTTGTLNVAVGANALQVNTTGVQNAAVGQGSLISNTTGFNNAAVGGSTLAANTTGERNSAVGYGALFSNTTGNRNTAIGQAALFLNTTASENTAVGHNAMTNNTTGANNTAVGRSAMSANTTANNNTAVGYNSLGANTTGINNTALGSLALDANDSASNNTAVGYASLSANTTGTSNTAVGSAALAVCTTGDNNTAVGSIALDANTSGIQNTAVGSIALSANTTGGSNNAFGVNALASNTTGGTNSAFGNFAMVSSTTGSSNTAVGASALHLNTTASNNVAVGFQSLYANTTGTNNTAIGCQAGNVLTTGSDCVSIGYGSDPSDSAATGEFTLGNSAITNLRCNDTTISTLSDERDKTDIVDNSYGLDLVNALQTREYTWDTREGNVKDGQTRTGFIAQEVLAAAGAANDVLDLVNVLRGGDLLELKQGNLIPVLVKAIQELSAEVEALKNA